MVKSHLHPAVAVIGLAALLAAVSGCQPALPVENAADARDAAIGYLQEHDGQSVPGEDVEWQEEDTAPEGIAGAARREFSSGEWTVVVSYPVLPRELTVYQVLVLSGTEPPWQWEGSVNPDASVTELSPLKQTPEV
jgi:hypothetical protein